MRQNHVESQHCFIWSIGNPFHLYSLTLVETLLNMASFCNVFHGLHSNPSLLKTLNECFSRILAMRRWNHSPLLPTLNNCSINTPSNFSSRINIRLLSIKSTAYWDQITKPIWALRRRILLAYPQNTHITDCSHDRCLPQASFHQTCCVSHRPLYVSRFCSEAIKKKIWYNKNAYVWNVAPKTHDSQVSYKFC